VLVQALGPELTIERLDVRIVGGFAGPPGEVQDHIPLICPQIEVSGDELAPIVHPDHLRITQLLADPLKRLHNIVTTVAEPRIGGRRVAGMGIDDGQEAQFPDGGQLIVHKIHGPDLVGLGGIGSVIPKVGLDPTFGCLVPQLQPQLVVKPTGSLHVDRPGFPQQKDMHTPIPVANPGLADLLDPQLEIGLLTLDLYL
jgi:hypothetical protein